MRKLETQSKRINETEIQLLRYAFVGTIGALINMGVTTILHGLLDIHYFLFLGPLKIDFFVAFFNGIGILLAFIFNFYYNKTWTFKKNY